MMIIRVGTIQFAGRRGRWAISIVAHHGSVENGCSFCTVIIAEQKFQVLFIMLEIADQLLCAITVLSGEAG